MKKRIAQALITTLVMSSLVTVPVLAAPGDSVDALESEKQAVEAAASDVNSRLVELLVQFDALKQDMANQKERIAQAEGDYKAASEKEQEQYEAMKLRIQYMYEEGDASFLETVVSSKNFSDLVNKSEYVQKVHSYDRKMLNEYIDTKKEVESLKQELESGEAEMEAMAEELTSQQTSLEGTLADMRGQIADFDNQLAAAKEEAEEQLGELTEDTENMTIPSQDDGNKQAAGDNKPASNDKGSNTASKPSGSTNGGGSKPSNNNTSKPSNNNSNTTSKPSNNSSSNTSKPSNASLGQQIASKACTYVGNPYVYGGTSLTNGADCSGFVQSVHRLFGISTPRDSWSQLNGGKAVSYSNMLPGDVIVYSGHVAIYIGGGQIVHASNSKPYPAGGIKISKPANYRTVLGVRRYW